MGLSNVNLINNPWLAQQQWGGVNSSLNNMFNNQWNGFNNFNVFDPYQQSFKGAQSNSGLRYGETFEDYYARMNKIATTPLAPKKLFKTPDPVSFNKLALGASEIEKDEEIGGVDTALKSAASFAAFENAGAIINPSLTLDAMEDTTASLKNINTNFYKENEFLDIRKSLNNSYKRLNTLSGARSGKLPKADIKEINKWRRELLKELKKKNPDFRKVIEYQSKLDAASSVKHGRLVLNKANKLKSSKQAVQDLSQTQNSGILKRFLGKQSTGTVMEQTVSNAEKLKAAGQIGRMGKDALKTFKGFAIFDGAIECITKVIPAFKKGGTDSGFKQLGQSAVNVTAKTAAFAAGRAIGKVAGHAIGKWAGAWAGAKLGLALGSTCGPLGTIIGGAVGLIAGCVASLFAEKGVNYLFKGGQEIDKLNALENANNLDQICQNVLIVEKAIKEKKNISAETMENYKSACQYLDEQGITRQQLDGMV